MELKNIVETIKKNKITAYEIAKNSLLTEVGINKILNGTSQNPRKSTLKILEDYITNYANTEINKQKNNSLKTEVELSNTDDEVEIFVNKNGVKFYEYPDGSTKIEVIKIPFDAYATYLEAYNDEEKLYAEFSTATFSVDKVAKGNYLAFNIKNNSMNGGGINDTPSGAEVLAREVGQHLWNKDFHKTPYGFILMTKNAIYHKDIGDYNKETGMLTLLSRNENDQQFEIHMNDIYRIFNVIKRTF